MVALNDPVGLEASSADLQPQLKILVAPKTATSGQKRARPLTAEQSWVPAEVIIALRPHSLQLNLLLMPPLLQRKLLVSPKWKSQPSAEGRSSCNVCQAPDAAAVNEIAGNCRLTPSTSILLSEDGAI